MDLLQGLESVLENSNMGEAMSGLHSGSVMDEIAGALGAASQGSRQNDNPLGALAGMFGGAASQGNAGGQGGLGALGALAGMFGGGMGGGGNAQSDNPLGALAGMFGGASGMGGTGGSGAGGLFGALGGLLGGAGGSSSQGNPLDMLSSVLGGGGKKSLVGTAALGGLIGALLSSKAARGIAGGALLAGGGAMLWNKYKQRIQETNAQDDPSFGQAPSPTGVRAERILRALIYAVKSDGKIDEQEAAALQTYLGKLNLGDRSAQIVQAAINEPLDPQALARDIKSADEALEVYTVSCAVIHPDDPAEKQYLDALAKALGIPADVKQEMDAQHAAAVHGAPATS